MDEYEAQGVDLRVDDELGLEALYEQRLRPVNLSPDEEPEDENAWWDDPGAEPPDHVKPDDRVKDIFDLETDEVEASLDLHGETEDAGEDAPWYDSLAQHPIYRTLLEANRQAQKKRLIRELKDEALERIEFAARSMQDYEQVVHFWDKKDASAARTRRIHEQQCGDTPLEWNSHLHDTSGIDMIFPEWMNDPTYRQLKRGNFLDYLFDCPYEMHDLTARDYLRRPIMELKEEHKEILYFLYLRLYTPQRLACLREQSDRNIRKVRDVILRHVRRQVYDSLLQRQANGCILTLNEKTFLEEFTPEGIKKPKKEGA